MPFGTILGKDNKPFKTREGALIKLSELLDEAIARASKLLQDREVQSKNPDIDDAELADLAEIIKLARSSMRTYQRIVPATTSLTGTKC